MSDKINYTGRLLNTLTITEVGFVIKDKDGKIIIKQETSPKEDGSWTVEDKQEIGDSMLMELNSSIIKDLKLDIRKMIKTAYENADRKPYKTNDGIILDGGMDNAIRLIQVVDSKRRLGVELSITDINDDKFTLKDEGDNSIPKPIEEFYLYSERLRDKKHELYLQLKGLKNTEDITSVGKRLDKEFANV